jgi:hypothetical protein
VTHKCRCTPCTEANRDYARNRERHLARVAYGIEQPRPDRYINANEVRNHIAWLRTYGIGLRTIADRTKIARTTLQQLATGESKMVTPHNANLILAISTFAQPAAAHVDAAPTWALINDLLYLGYTKKAVALALGSNTPVLQVGRTRITRRTADLVTQLHYRWKDAGVDWHGTISAYNERKCRCIACRAIATEKQQQHRSNKRDTAA